MITIPRFASSIQSPAHVISFPQAIPFTSGPMGIRTPNSTTGILIIPQVNWYFRILTAIAVLRLSRLWFPRRLPWRHAWNLLAVTCVRYPSNESCALQLHFICNCFWNLDLPRSYWDKRICSDFEDARRKSHSKMETHWSAIVHSLGYYSNTCVGSKYDNR